MPVGLGGPGIVAGAALRGGAEGRSQSTVN